MLDYRRAWGVAFVIALGVSMLTSCSVLNPLKEETTAASATPTTSEDSGLSEDGDWIVPKIPPATPATVDSLYLGFPEVPSLDNPEFGEFYLDRCVEYLHLVGSAEDSAPPEEVFTQKLLQNAPELVASVVALDDGTLLVAPAADGDGDLNAAIKLARSKLTDEQRAVVSEYRISVGDPKPVAFATHCEVAIAVYQWWIASNTLGNAGYTAPLVGGGVDSSGVVTVLHEPFTRGWQAELEKLQGRYPGAIEELIVDPESARLLYNPSQYPGIRFPEVLVQ